MMDTNGKHPYTTQGWYCTDLNDPDYYAVTMKRGIAIDHPITENGTLTPVKLHINHPERLPSMGMFWTAMGSFNMPEIPSDLYDDPQDAIDAAKKCGIKDWQIGGGEGYNWRDLEGEDKDYEPVATPFAAALKIRSSDDRLVGKVNLHPDLNGLRGPKTPIYPSRNCPEDLHEGPVLVTKVIDKGHYAFVDAVQMTYNAPSYKQIRYYVRRNCIRQAKVRFVRTKFGEIAQLRVKGKKGFRSVNLCSEGGRIRNCSEVDGFLRQDEIEVLRETTVADILAIEDRGVNLDELKAVFKPVTFRFEPRDMRRTTPYGNDDIDWAVNIGFITQYIVVGVPFFRVNDDLLVEYMGTDIADRIAKFVAPINEQAQARFESMIRKTRMMVRDGVAVFHT